MNKIGIHATKTSTVIFDKTLRKAERVDRTELKDNNIYILDEKYKGIVIYRNNKIRCLGILTSVRFNAAELVWIRTTDFEESRFKSDILYNEDMIVDIDDDNCLTSEWVNDIKVRYRTEPLAYAVYATTLEYIRGDEEMEEINDKAVIGNKVENNETNMINYKKEEVEDNNTVIIGVDTIYSFEGSTETEFSAPDYMYEMLLKMVSVDDCITINSNYYSKLKAYLKKNLESNQAYTKYKQIVSIKFESNSEYNLLAIVDRDEEKNTTRLTILKPFNKIKTSDEEIEKFYEQYRKIRKQNSFSTRG